MSYASQIARRIASLQKKGSSPFERRKSPFDRKRTMPGSNTDASENIARQDDPIGSCKVTCSALNVRSGAGSGYPRIGGLTNGKSVQVYAVEGDWLKIKYGTGFGWVAKKYTDFKGSSLPAGALFEVIVTGSVKVRTGPGKDNNSIGTLHKGDRVVVYEVQGDWYRIEYNGQVGWFHGSYSEVVPGSETGEQPPGPGPGPGGNDDDKVAAAGKDAEAYARYLMGLGWKYTYNSEERWKDGYYDCSSFCCRCWAHAGYDFGHSASYSMAKKCDEASATVASLNDVIPGDLLFFSLSSNSHYKGISHVAIASNSKEMVDPGTKSIAIVDPKSSYYDGKLVSIGRPGKMM